MASVVSTTGFDYNTSSLVLSNLVDGTANKEFTTLQPVSSVRHKEDFSVPDDLPLDIRIKMAVCLIHRKYHACIEVCLSVYVSQFVKRAHCLLIAIL